MRLLALAQTRRLVRIALGAAASLSLPPSPFPAHARDPLVQSGSRGVCRSAAQSPLGIREGGKRKDGASLSPAAEAARTAGSRSVVPQCRPMSGPRRQPRPRLRQPLRRNANAGSGQGSDGDRRSACVRGWLRERATLYSNPVAFTGYRNTHKWLSPAFRRRGGGRQQSSGAAMRGLPRI